MLIREERLVSGTARAILANSGCANACTGELGDRAARETTAAIAAALGCDESQVLPASTGVIGALLPSARIVGHVGELVAALSPTKADDFARAILTTDRFPKVSTTDPAGGARMMGIAKGAGMIHPDLGPHATMLAFLFTDAIRDRGALEQGLVAAAEDSFNSVSVDGDTSTNDTLIVLASGASGKAADAAEIQDALGRVRGNLARDMVADGEGAEHVAEILVRGLGSHAEARQVARTIATSLLWKTAMFGCDANWGRVLAAAGRSGVRFDPNRAIIRIGGVDLVRGGMPMGGDSDARAGAAMRGEKYVVEVVLGEGPGRGPVFGPATSGTSTSTSTPDTVREQVRLALLVIGIGCASKPGTIGAVIARDPEGDLVLHEVPEGLAADRAGLQPGDQIPLIEGEDVRQMDPKRVHQLLSGSVGDPVKLTVVRGEAILRVSVKRTEARKRSSRRASKPE
ncbi:MAG: bifunctional ornithine acetyltransferase/N-acetylglutamate synthase [Comamonadaceae bacterium]|nr:bifunctional ornithine acetyltransferase/N-acetylglutamate synthase [Comamonadaceae bacterium]